MRQKKQWRDFTPSQQVAIVVAGAVELVITSKALIDIARRPSPEVRGAKLAWVAAFFVQPLGPIAYLLFGRRSRPEIR